MNSKSIFFLVAALSIGYPSYSFSATANNEVVAEQKNSDGDILGILVVLNKNEIVEGQLAEIDGTTRIVKDYATMMIKQHGKNLDQTEQLAKAINAPIQKDKIAITLEEKGKVELESLKKLKGPEFDKAYIDAMVKGHKEALELITSLILESSNADVKKHLIATKVHIKNHLEVAEKIQKNHDE